VYKTPLLPTRLRGSSAIPDMFRHRKGHTPVLMHDRENKPRLGMTDQHTVSEKGLEEGLSPKPYAGRGGMKKLLAKRRLEEEKEKEKEKATVIETDEEEAVTTSQKARDLDEKLVRELEKPREEQEQEPLRPQVGGRVQSSLRVGRERTSRNHIARPKTKPKGGRFSALYEEDEDSMNDGTRWEESRDDVAIKLPTFQLPSGFSFAKDVRHCDILRLIFIDMRFRLFRFSMTLQMPRSHRFRNCLFLLLSL
jgi:nucleoporin NUP1